MHDISFLCPAGQACLTHSSLLVLHGTAVGSRHGFSLLLCLPPLFLQTEHSLFTMAQATHSESVSFTFSAQSCSLQFSILA